MNVYKLIIPVIVCVLTLIAQDNVAQEHQTIIKSIDSVMHANYAEHSPGAAIVVMKNHQLLFKSGYGKAMMQDSYQAPVCDHQIRSETKFRIGSITKQFTAIAILMMCEENKLSLDDEISHYYPKLFPKEKPINIRQLLSHTAGIRDLSKIKAVRQYMFAPVKPYDLIALISKEELEFEPGSAYEYSNAGYVILGGILEQVSGLDYRSFLQKRIFNPLGMHDSYYASHSEIIGPKALGYFARSDAYVDAPEISSSLLFSAGGIWSTVSDMARWNQGLYSETLLDQDYIQLAFTPNLLTSGVETDYGFGFRSCQVNDVASIEHGGGVFGYSSYGVRIPTHGIYVLILSNFERNNNYDELAPIVAAITMEKPYTSLGVNEMNEDLVRPYIGTYVSAKGDTFSVSWKMTKLILSIDDLEIQLDYMQPDLFRIKGSLDDRLKFNGSTSIFSLKRRRSMAVEANKL